MSARDLLLALAVAAALSLIAAPARGAESLASHYCADHHGKRTASGARFDMRALTAAHRRLAFGTRVKVTHARNGRSVTVTINDRGPAAWTGKAIDLSCGAFAHLASPAAGVVPVRIEVLK